MSREGMFRFTDEDVVTAPSRPGVLALPDLLRQVRRWSAGVRPLLVVDLSPAQETDMALYRTLLHARRQLRARGRDLCVVEPRAGALPTHAERVLRDLLPFHPDMASARRPAAGPPTAAPELAVPA